MNDRWRIEVGRVVVHGAPPGPIDGRELRALVGSAIGERLRAADLPPARWASEAVRIDAGRIASGPSSVADTVAGAIVGAVATRSGRGRGGGHG
jgi:hypothetical protein